MKTDRPSETVVPVLTAMTAIHRLRVRLHGLGQGGCPRQAQYELF